MTIRVLCVALGLSCLPLIGCGTTANLVRSYPDDGGKIPFGGVKQDLRVLRGPSPVAADGCPEPVPECKEYPGGLLKVVCAADLPFSFLGDLVTWPYVVIYRFINEPIAIPPLTHVPVIAVPPAPVAHPLPVLPPAKTEQPKTTPPTKQEPVPGQNPAPTMPPRNP